MTPRVACAVGAALAGIAVATGAFAAHGLRGRIDAELLAVFETAARYQMTHAIGLIVAALAGDRWPEARLAPVWWMFVIGTVLFSGSLYLLALTGIGALGAVTPFGGALLIAGWATFAWNVGRLHLGQHGDGTG